MQILKKKLSGPKKEIVLLNAGSALYINRKTENIQNGIEIAYEAIETGKALNKLEDLIKLSNS